ncbi:MAG: hypothetical protein M3417_14210, partial [Actinomycetota bacterium]|nr:hypothetical protein [Actinomycetota bacterium]
AVNMKRLVDRVGEAAQGRAAGPAAGALITLADAQGRCRAAGACVGAATGARARVEIPSDASMASVWSFAVSLN